MNSQLLFKEKLKGKWSAAQGSEGGRGRWTGRKIKGERR